MIVIEIEKQKEHRERLPVSVSAAVLIGDSAGHLLLVQQASERKGHKWGPPAGGIEAHETPIDAAIREAKEEIGVDVRLLNLVGIYTADRGDTRTGIAFVFRGEIVSGKIQPKKGEIQDYKYFTKDEVRLLNMRNQLYKPEYNLPSIMDWKSGKMYPLEIVNDLVLNGVEHSED